MGKTANTAPIGYSDGGLIRGSYKITIDGTTYLLKEGKVQNPAREEKEYGVQGEPDSQSIVKDFSTMSVTIMAKKNLPDPETKRMKPFAFKGDVWLLASTEFAFSTAGLQVYTGTINKLVNEPVDPIYAE